MARARYTFDHIAIGVQRIADAGDVMAHQLGGRPLGGGSGLRFSTRQWSFKDGGRLELIAPGRGSGGFMQRFLDSRGPGIHHVTFKVPDFEAAAERTRRLGYEVVGYSGRFPGWKEFFVHPKQADGILLQFAYSAVPTRLVRAVFSRLSSGAGPRGEVVGLRFNQHSRKAALRQWRDVCRGELRSDADALVFHWPGSAMRVAVGIDPDAAVGPQSIELRTLPEALRQAGGPHPMLGTRFVATEE